MIKIIECPRDAMQGIDRFIATSDKIAYMELLLKAGFHSLDFGSFVSPRAIPQMRDTAEVLAAIEDKKGQTRLLAIVANLRGVQDAVGHKSIDYLGFPFSVSETFQQRNTNSSMADSLDVVKQARELCVKSGKELVVYMSMGFGNPYGDPWSPSLVEDRTAEIISLGVRTISLSDTIGMANPESISALFSSLIPAFPEVSFGAHLHTQPHNWREKVDAAYTHGCRRFDGAIKGYGGCPMAADELTGNMPTENLLAYFKEKGEDTGVDEAAFATAMQKAVGVFSH